jgi:hypothetical protein
MSSPYLSKNSSKVTYFLPNTTFRIAHTIRFSELKLSKHVCLIFFSFVINLEKTNYIKFFIIVYLIYLINKVFNWKSSAFPFV